MLTWYLFLLLPCLQLKQKLLRPSSLWIHLISWENERMTTEKTWVNLQSESGPLEPLICQWRNGQNHRYNGTFILADTVNDSVTLRTIWRTASGTCLENTSHLHGFINGKWHTPYSIYIQKNDFFLQTQGSRITWKTKWTHMIVTLGGSTEQDCAATLRSSARVRWARTLSPSP